MPSPEPTVSTTNLAEQLVRLTRRMHRTQKHHLEHLDIAFTPAQSRLLRIVGHYRDTPPRMADLAERLEVVPRAVTTLVDGLEATRRGAPGARSGQPPGGTDRAHRHRPRHAARAAQRAPGRRGGDPGSTDRRTARGARRPADHPGRRSRATAAAETACGSRTDRRSAACPCWSRTPRPCAPLATGARAPDRVPGRQASRHPGAAARRPDRAARRRTRSCTRSPTWSATPPTPAPTASSRRSWWSPRTSTTSPRSSPTRTARAATSSSGPPGTSLNGQAQGEDILVDVRRHWAGIEVLDDGARARHPAGHDGAARQRHARPARPAARPRSGQRASPAPSAAWSPTTPPG